MTFWKAWFDTRRKFYLCVILVTLLMAPGTITLAVRSVQASRAATGAAVNPETEASIKAFSRSVEGWVQGDAYSIFSVLAIVLGVGGTMTLGNARSNLMTLSLPQRRARWLLAQWAVAVLLLLLLCAFEAIFFVVTGWISGLGTPTADLAMATVLTTLAAMIWIWPSILSTAFTRDAVRAALIMVSGMVALRTVAVIVGLQEWGLRQVADLSQWRGNVPWQPLVAGLAMTAVAAWWALRKFERTEF